MNPRFKQTLRFVMLIATPLCLVNAAIFSWGSEDFYSIWMHRFIINFLISFPQAVLYVSIIKWYDKKRTKTSSG